VATEWGSPRFFHNDAGHLVEWKPALGPKDGAALTGAWNSVTAGDFDEDGRIDLILGNAGTNLRQTASPQAPRRLYFGDLGSGAGNDLVEAWHDAASNADRPEREYMALGTLFPMVRERVPTHAGYSTSSVQTLFGDFTGRASRLELDTQASVVLLNRGGGGFDVRALPAAAQWSPAYGLCVADYDGDGHDDVFLAQNTSTAQPFAERSDAGRGLWLRGDGKGGFTADLATGVAVHGDGRGAAVADFDGDGRIDLAVAQNGAATTLWHNIAAKPGLRIRLQGTGANPSAIGAAVRLAYADHAGPWRELHLGAGYWSCDDPVIVLGRAGEPVAVEVRWPGGKTTRHPLAAGEAEVRIPGPQ